MPTSGPGAAPQRMTICTDNLMKSPGQGKSARPASSCKYKLLKDTADEAVIESTCNGRTSTVAVKRESANSMLMSMQSDGPRGPQTMKMRYTHLGACREGQGAVTMDPDSEQCRRMKERRASFEPQKACARREWKSDGERVECERKVREAVERLSAMCG